MKTSYPQIAQITRRVEEKGCVWEVARNKQKVFLSISTYLCNLRNLRRVELGKNYELSNDHPRGVSCSGA